MVAISLSKWAFCLVYGILLTIQGCGDDSKKQSIEVPVADVEMLEEMRKEKQDVEAQIQQQQVDMSKNIEGDGEQRQVAYDEAKLSFAKADCIGKMTVLPLAIQKLFLKNMAFPADVWHERRNAFTKQDLQSIFDGAKMEQLQNFVDELERLKIDEAQRTKEEWEELVEKHPDVFLGENVAKSQPLNWEQVAPEKMQAVQDQLKKEEAIEGKSTEPEQKLTDLEMHELTPSRAKELFKVALAERVYETNSDTDALRDVLQSAGFKDEALKRAHHFFIMLYHSKGGQKDIALEHVKLYCSFYKEVKDSWPKKLCFWDHCRATWKDDPEHTKEWMQEYSDIHGHDSMLFEKFLQYQYRAAEFQRTEILLTKVMNIMKQEKLTYSQLGSEQKEFLSRLQQSWTQLSQLQADLYDDLQASKSKLNYVDAEDLDFSRSGWLRQWDWQDDRAKEIEESIDKVAKMTPAEVKQYEKEQKRAERRRVKDQERAQRMLDRNL